MLDLKAKISNFDSFLTQLKFETILQSPAYVGSLPDICPVCKCSRAL